jgi:hypothetical protein
VAPAHRRGACLQYTLPAASEEASLDAALAAALLLGEAG